MADIFEIAGRVHSTSQEGVVTVANEILDSNANKKQSQINSEVETRLNAYETGKFVNVETYAELPASGEVDTIYRVANWDGEQVDTTKYAEYSWDGTQYVLLGVNKNDDVIRTDVSQSLSDAEKKQARENLGMGNGDFAVASDFTNPDATKRAKVPTVGAIVDGLNDGIYDVSKRNPTGGPNSDGKFTLDYILDNANTLIPTGWRHGGMTISFVDSYDNKYIRYNLLADEFTTDITQWAIDDVGVYVENPEYVYVKTDGEGKILWAIKTDGGIYYGAGVPQQVIDYIQEKIEELSLDEYEDIVAFLNGLEEGDKTLQQLLNDKVDKEEGKGLIPTQYINKIDSVEFIRFVTDSNGRIIEAVRTDGTKLVNGNLNVGGDAKVLGNMEISGVSYNVMENPEFIAAWLDISGKIVFGLKTDGKTYIGDADFLKSIKDNQTAISEIQDTLSAIIPSLGQLDFDALMIFTANDNPEFITVEIDNDGKILSSRGQDGIKKEYIGLETPRIQIKGNNIFSINDTEDRTEIKLDSNDKILSYRDKEGVLHESIGIESPVLNTNNLNLTQEGMTEFQQALKDSGFKPGGSGDWSEYISDDGNSPLRLPEPQCALLNIKSDVDLTALKKEGLSGAVEGVNYNVPVEVEYYDMIGNYFRKWAIISGQGRSSMVYKKKNIAIDFFDAEVDGDALAIRFGDWVPQDSFHLKAYYTDAFRGIAVVGYELYKEFINTHRPSVNRAYKKYVPQIKGWSDGTEDEGISVAANFDESATCFPQGFPILVYQQGVFYGVFSFQIKKHRDNYRLSSKDGNNIHLDSVINGRSILAANGNASKIGWDCVNEEFKSIEVRNPKANNKPSKSYLFLQSDGSCYNSDTHAGEILGEYIVSYDTDNWEGLKYATSSEPATGLWDAATNYSADDEVWFPNEYGTIWMKFKAIQANVNKPCAIYTANPVYDSTNKNHKVCAKAKKNILKFSTYLPELAEMEASGATTSAIRERIQEMFDVPFMIDYIIFSGIIANIDGWSSNWQWVTWDGNTWVVNPYDLDATFGADAVGVSTTKSYAGVSGRAMTIPTGWVWKYFADDEKAVTGISGIKERYAELRDKKIIDSNHITQMLIDWIRRIPVNYWEKEYDKWNQTPAFRKSYINTDYWEFVERAGGEAVDYDPEANYSVGDTVIIGGNSDVDRYRFRCVQACQGEAPYTQTYSDYPYYLGHYDSPYRVIQWLDATIANADITMGYNQN